MNTKDKISTRSNMCSQMTRSSCKPFSILSENNGFKFKTFHEGGAAEKIPLIPVCTSEDLSDTTWTLITKEKPRGKKERDKIWARSVLTLKHRERNELCVIETYFIYELGFNPRPVSICVCCHCTIMLPLIVRQMTK